MGKRARCLVWAGSQGPFTGEGDLGPSLSCIWDVRDMRIKLGYDHVNLCSLSTGGVQESRATPLMHTAEVCVGWGPCPLASLPLPRVAEGFLQGTGQSGSLGCPSGVGRWVLGSPSLGSAFASKVGSGLQ